MQGYIARNHRRLFDIAAPGPWHLHGGPMRSFAPHPKSKHLCANRPFVGVLHIDVRAVVSPQGVRLASA